MLLRDAKIAYYEQLLAHPEQQSVLEQKSNKLKSYTQTLALLLPVMLVVSLWMKLSCLVYMRLLALSGSVILTQV